MTRFVDAARPVRDGEELDLERLDAHLDEHLDRSLGDLDGPLQVLQFPSGFSNLTYLLRKGALEMVLRRPPFGNRVRTAHDMGREHRVLHALQGAYPPAPRPYLLCEDESVLGAPFYLMERRRGVVLRRELPAGLQLSPVLAQRLCESFVDRLVELHRVDYEAVGLADLGHPEGYAERQVRGWMKRYEKAQTDAWPAFDEVGAWLADEVSALAAAPAEGSRAALIHNDFKYDNLLLDPDDLHRVVGVLDWEMATLGDPLMDLGTTLAYWVEADDPEPLRRSSFGPTSVPGSLSRRQLAERWAEAMDRDLDDLVFYYVFGLYKLGVIVQQIYYRYAQGHTSDPRFAQINQLVGLLGQVGAATIVKGAI